MPDWPPMLAAEERVSGTWTMVAPDGREYGLGGIRRVDGQIAYRVTALRRPAGYTSTLRKACQRIHHTFIAAHSPGPPPDLSGIIRGGRAES